MALRTVSNTGGNWNATTSWVGGVVPIAGDTVDFTPTSGPIVVNVSTANLVGIDFTNYVNTITFNNPINTNGIVNLGTGGYTQAGTSGLVINSSATISGSTTWSRTFTVSLGSVTATITLSSNLNITGLLTLSVINGTLNFTGAGILNPTGNLTLSGSAVTGTINLPNTLNIVDLIVSVGTTTLIINGNSINVSGNLTTIGTTGFTGGTTNINLVGNGIWSNTSTSVSIRNPLIFNTSGTITISGNVYYGGNTITYTLGTITTTNSTLNIQTLCSLNTSGMSWYNITYTGSGVVNTLLSDLNITNNLNTLSTDFNGLFNVNIGGNLTVTGNVSGTSSIVLNGNGTWSHTNTGVVRNNLTINSPSGTITIGTNVYYNTGILTYTAGTVDTTTNNSTLNISLSTTLNTNGINWNNVTLSGGIQTLTSNLNILGNLTTQTSSITINGLFNVNVSGNLSINITTSGTATTIINGTGAQTWSHGSVVYLGNNLTINKTSGTLTIGTNVYYNTGTLTYTAGTVDTTTNNSTLNINTTTTLNTGVVNWNNVSISLPSNISITITLSSNFNIIGTTTLTHPSSGNITLSFSGVGLLNSTGALTIINSSNSNFSFTITIPNSLTITNLTLATGVPNNVHSIVLNTNSININGNLTQTNGTGNFTISGTTNLNLIGTGIWSHSGANYIQNNLTINSPSGTITISGNVYYRTGTLTYTSGATIITTGSTLNINASSTLDTSGMTWNNVILSGTQTLSSGLNIGGNLTTQSTAVVLSGIVNVNVSGSLTINTTTSGTATIILNGTSTQTWSASSYLSNNLTINKSSGTLTIGSNVYYNTGTLLYTTGIVDTTTNSSTLNINATTTLNTNGITWNNVSISLPSSISITITLSSNFNVTGTTTFTHSSSGNITLSFSGVGLLNSSGALTINNNSSSNFSFTITVPTSLTITNLTLTTGIPGNVHSIILNSNSININGNLTISGGANLTISGTTNLNLIGTGIWSHTSTPQLRNNLTINSPSGTITISGNVYYNTGTLTYTSGLVTTIGSILNINTSTTLNTSGMTWNSITITSGTITLSSNLTVGGTLTLTGTMTGAFTITTLNLTTGTSVINVTSTSVSGNLTINGSTSGTSPITLNGTGAQIWSHGSAVYLSNNLTINKSLGTLTIGTNVYYNTNTLTYTTGTVDTTTNNSTLNINVSTTLNSNGLSWNNLTISGNTTLTLPTDLIFIGTCSMVGSGTTTITLAGVGIINAILGTLQLTVSGGNLTLTTSATHNILNYQFNAGGFAINGSGTWNVYGNLIRNGAGNGRSATGTINFLGSGSILFNGGSTGAFVGVWNINPSGTLTFGSVTFPNVYYEQSTITYIGGTVDASNCNLLIGFTITSQTTTLNTSPINWKNITLSGTNTLLLTSNLNLTGNLTTQSGVITINGLFNVNVGGNLTINFTTNGTSTIVLNGTGTQTWLTAGYYLSNNLTFNKPSGTLTIGTNVYYQTGTITYVTGTIDTTTNNSTLILGSSTIFNTNTLFWSNIYISTNVTITLNSILLIGSFTVNQFTLSWVTNNYTVSISGDMVIGSTFYGGGGSTTVSIPNDVYVKNLTLNTTAYNSTTGIYPTVVNGSNIYVSGNLTIGNYSYITNPITGTSGIILNGTGTFSMSFNGFVYASLNNNLTINTGGVITFLGNLLYNTGTLTYLSGKVITKNSVLYLQSSTTLINCNKINFDRVIITGGVTITMNQFFDGNPNLKTNISSSSTNYTITFQDGFEKFSKFIKLSRATISRPNQLTVITDKGNQGNNVGVKFAPNQLANGLPKNTPSTSTVTPYGLQPSYLVTDPTLS